MPDFEIRVQQEFPIRFKEHASFHLHLSLSYISFSSHDFNHVVFSCFWGTQMMSKAREEGEDFDEDSLHGHVAHTATLKHIQCVQ